MRMLQGIVQPPTKNYKRHDKMSKKDFWEARKLKALQRGINLSSTEDEDLETHVEATGNRRKRRVRVQPTADESQHPPCPEGFDPKKWSKMTLAEKCAHLGIEVEEWLRMTREQQMRRMHDLANNFHFYAFDKV